MPEVGGAKALGPGTEPEPTSVWAFILRLAEDVLVHDDYKFHVFAPFAEKHGSWEATFYRPPNDDDNGIWRYIFLDLTKDRDSHLVEVWALAEKEPENRDQAKYHRHSVHEFTTKDQVKFFSENQDVTADFRQTVIGKLKEAAEFVLKLETRHLTSTYPRLLPRRHLHSRTAAGNEI